MFREDKELLTEGQFYFVPEDTPRFKGEQPFCSLQWFDGELEEYDGLGEVLGAERIWVPGDPPPRIPDKAAGNASYFLLGDSGPGVQVGPDWVWSILPDCYDAKIPDYPRKIGDFDLSSQALLYMLATLCRTTYETVDVKTAALLMNWMGAPSALQFSPNTSSAFPGSVIAVYPNFTLVAISGTTNNVQWALQPLYSLIGPTDWTWYGSNALWRTAAFDVASRINAFGVDPSAPIFLTGHSYGGAVACNLAAIYQRAQPDRDIRLLTFAAPKSGDFRLAEICRTIGLVNIQAYGDPVPALPPSLYWLGAFSPLFALAILENWARFQTCGEVHQLGVDGSLTMTADPVAFYADVAAIALAVSLSIAPPPFSAHFVETYCSRLYAGIPPGWDHFPVRATALAAARALYP